MLLDFIPSGAKILICRQLYLDIVSSVKRATEDKKEVGGIIFAISDSKDPFNCYCCYNTLEFGNGNSFLRSPEAESAIENIDLFDLTNSMGIGHIKNPIVWYAGDWHSHTNHWLPSKIDLLYLDTYPRSLLFVCYNDILSMWGKMGLMVMWTETTLECTPVKQN